MGLLIIVFLFLQMLQVSISADLPPCSLEYSEDFFVHSDQIFKPLKIKSQQLNSNIPCIISLSLPSSPGNVHTLHVHPNQTTTIDIDNQTRVNVSNDNNGKQNLWIGNTK